MSAALRLREDYDAQHMRALAKASRDAKQTRRLLALAAIVAVCDRDHSLDPPGPLYRRAGSRRRHPGGGGGVTNRRPGGCSCREMTSCSVT